MRVSGDPFHLSLHHPIYDMRYMIAVGNETYPLIHGDAVVMGRKVSTVGNSSLSVVAIDTEIGTPSL